MKGIGQIILNLCTVFGGVNSFKIFDTALGAPLHFILTNETKKLLIDLGFDPDLLGLLRWSDDYCFILCGTNDFQTNDDLAKEISTKVDAELKFLGVEFTTIEWSQEMVTLGLGLSAAEMEAFVTEERRIYMLIYVQRWRQDHIDKVKKPLHGKHDSWSSIAGALRFVSLVMEMGHVFVCPFDAMIGAMTAQEFNFQLISKTIDVCLEWFEKRFIDPQRCRRSLIVNLEWKQAEKMGLLRDKPAVDASFKGRGFWYKDCYYESEWSEEVLAIAKRESTYDINFLEAYNCVDACASLGEEFRNKSIILETDSKVWEQVWSNGRAKCPYLTALLICLADICEYYNFRLRIVHIEGKVNVGADLLSRGCVQEFLESHPNARRLKVLPWITEPTWPESTSFTKKRWKKTRTSKVP